MGNLGESFDTAWNLVKEEPDESTDAWDDVHYRGKDNCDSCGSYRDPNSDYCRDCFDGATPKDRNNPNPHPLDGMLDDSFVSANEAYSLWDEGYEPNYDSVVEAAKSVLEAMGYKVSKPIEMGPEMLARIPEVEPNETGSDEWLDWYDKGGEKNE